MNHTVKRALLGAAMLMVAGAAHASDGLYTERQEFQVAQACGYYVILGCFKNENAAWNRVDSLGGAEVATVIWTNDFPNFRNGWFCAADGPYNRKSLSNSVRNDLKSQVSDAYVKNGC
jgi:hypothetical protein